jgi:hypothetical protein
MGVNGRKKRGDRKNKRWKFDTMTISIMTLSIKTVSITTFNIKTLRIMTFSIFINNATLSTMAEHC